MKTSFITPYLLYLVILFLIPSSSSSSFFPKNDESTTSTFSCGDLHDIPCPFFLEGRPRNCLDRPSNFVKLSCKNNRTILNISSANFYVIDINYEKKMLRLIDTGLEKDDCSSMPRTSLTEIDFSSYQPESSHGSFHFRNPYERISLSNKAVVYMSCSPNTSSSARYLKASPCLPASFDKSLFVIVDPLVLDFKESCHDFLTSFVSTDIDKFGSYLDVHNEMMNGFLVYWDLPMYGRGAYARATFGTTRSFVRMIYEWCNLPPGFRTTFSTIGSFLLSIYLLVRYILVPPLLVGILIYVLRKRNRAMNASIEDFLDMYRDQMPVRYSYSDIKRMTSNYKEKLGQGGFGSVYKGSLSDDRDVAIKILSSTKGDGQDFINEVATMGRIHHVNVVQLIGFVAERSKQALVYELMPNGSLEKYLFPREKGKHINLLSWERTYRIALGIARGIEYLHRGCGMQILHFDIKPHNILLDENYNPKISDFGLARSYLMDASIISVTRGIRGTIGYMAPELFYRNIGGVSYKSDVYSFGMLLMEMAGRRKNLNPLAENSSQIYFPTWIYSQLKQGEDTEMEDTTHEENEIAKKIIIVALWCIQLKPIDRPSMTKVVEMLDGELGILRIPQKPFSIADCDSDEHVMLNSVV